MEVLVIGLLLLAGFGLAAFALHRLLQRHRERSVGSLMAVDRLAAPTARMRSPRYRISGRPDELRRGQDGRVIPVEWKSRAVPRGGPPASHRLQLYAYCLLVEETYGRPPPFGVLRYGDGSEFHLGWDAGSRAELLEVRGAMARRYDGRALPSVGKCRGCRWHDGCDARAA